MGAESPGTPEGRRGLSASSVASRAERPELQRIRAFCATGNPQFREKGSRLCGLSVQGPTGRFGQGHL
jgi:hypothetical protein